MKNQWCKLFEPLQGFSSLLVIQKLKLTRWIAFLLIMATINLTQGCYYFKVNTKNEPTPEAISELNDRGKNFILHLNDKTWRLMNVSLTNNTLSGEVLTIDYSHTNYRVNTEKPNRYYKKTYNDQRYLLNEVHLYVEELIDLGNNKVSVPTSSILKVDIYDKDTATTTGSWMLGALGVAGGVILLLAIIILIFKESCPFIYTHNGENYEFAGEIFSGAIQPGLERHDYLVLPELKPYQDRYFLKVTNEVKEIQHINLMELEVIDHAENVNVLMDKYGQVQTYIDPVLPNKAETYSGQNVLAHVNRKDNFSYNFNESASYDVTFDEIVLTFNKPLNAQNGKLLIRAKNSLWLEHVFSSFHDMFGRMYNTFDKKEAKKPADELRKLMFEQGFPLKVYLERNGEWVLQDFYEIAGPMAMKNDVLALDMKDISNETVKIKLETGLMFWELDYAAMDFSENAHVNKMIIPAIKAQDENNVDINRSIKQDDQAYYSQPIIGNEAVLTFPVPELTEESRTIVLHSKGYYKIIREQKGRAQWKKLKSFRDPGRMAHYSRELYEEFYALTFN